MSDELSDEITSIEAFALKIIKHRKDHPNDLSSYHRSKMVRRYGVAAADQAIEKMTKVMNMLSGNAPPKRITLSPNAKSKIKGMKTTFVILDDVLDPDPNV